MDADIEMSTYSGSNKRSFADNVLPVDTPISESEQDLELRQSRRQRRLKLCLYMVLFVGIIYFVGSVYLSRDEEAILPLNNDIKAGMSDEEVDQHVQQVSKAYGKKTPMKPGHVNSWWKDYVNKTVLNGTIATNEVDNNVKPIDVGTTVHADWLEAKVTKHDGKMYEIVERLKHDKNAFTEGLAFANGALYESVGLKGQSDVRRLDPKTGEVVTSMNMDKTYFGEGLTIRGDKLYQLTYKKKKGFIYDIHDLDGEPGVKTPKTKVEEFDFDTSTHEGWGFTYDEKNDEFIVSDGSASILFWNCTTFKTNRVLSVTRMNGQPARNMNELEYWRDRIIANIWYEDVIIVINPKTGAVEKEYDFSSLWPKNDRRFKGADVLNGISVSADPDILYVTGKNWDRMFRVRLLV